MARSAASSTSNTHIARKLIEDNQDKMHSMAKALLEWETIDAEQVEDIMDGRRAPRPPKDWTHARQGAAFGPTVPPAATRMVLPLTV